MQLVPNRTVSALRHHVSSAVKHSVIAERVWSYMRPNVSYSQFGEDVYLKGYYDRLAYERNIVVNKGCFVDIGAFRPIMCSNSYLFYKRGWRGINIDPTPGFKRRFDRARSGDTNLEIGIAPAEGTATFFTFGLPSVYNTLDPSTASSAAQVTGITPSETTVTLSRLDSVFRQYLGDRPIELLLIDAEGYDIEIIRSNDFDQFRPRIILVEVLDQTYDSMSQHAVAAYLKPFGYELHAWLNPSLMFIRDDSLLR